VTAPGPPRVFAYGSLLYEPQHPEAVVRRQEAVLQGAVRAFDKISVPRGCAATHALHPAPEGFAVQGWHRSLALGLQTGVDGVVHGAVYTYDERAWPEVLAALERREGHDPDREDALNGYRRALRTLHTPTGPVTAWVYVSNPDSVWSGVYLPHAARAEVLAAATPRVADPYARGADYLVRTVHTLARADVHDPQLDALVQAVRRILGDRLDAASVG